MGLEKKIINKKSVRNFGFREITLLLFIVYFAYLVIQFNRDSVTEIEISMGLWGVFLFGVGVILQFFSLLRSELFSKKIAHALFGGILTSIFIGWLPFLLVFILLVFHGILLVPVKEINEGAFASSMYLLLYYISTIVVIAVVYRKKILPQITEASMAIHIAIFYYLVLLMLDSVKLAPIILIPLFVIATIILIVVTNKKQLSVAWESIIYIWYIITSIAFAVIQFVLGNQFFATISYTSGGALFVVSGTMAVVAGYVFTYVLLRLSATILPLCLWWINDDKAFTTTIIRHTKIISNKFSDIQTTSLSIWLPIVFIGGIATLNYTYKFINPLLLINLFIITIPIYERVVIKNM